MHHFKFLVLCVSLFFLAAVFTVSKGAALARNNNFCTLKGEKRTYNLNSGECALYELQAYEADRAAKRQREAEIRREINARYEKDIAKFDTKVEKSVKNGEVCRVFSFGSLKDRGTNC